MSWHLDTPDIKSQFGHNYWHQPRIPASLQSNPSLGLLSKPWGWYRLWSAKRNLWFSHNEWMPPRWCTLETNHTPLKAHYSPIIGKCLCSLNWTSCLQLPIPWVGQDWASANQPNWSQQMLLVFAHGYPLWNCLWIVVWGCYWVHFLTKKKIKIC